WRQWEFQWTPSEEAYYTILARARDAGRNTQPFEPEWNPSGYGWNVVPRIGVDVVKEPSRAALPAQPPGAPTAQPSALRTSCLVCHDEDILGQQRLTRAQWDREISKMTGWGAKVREDERQEILDYLINNYGPRPRGR